MTTYGNGPTAPPVSLAEFVGGSSSQSGNLRGEIKHRPSKLQTFFQGGAKRAKRQPFKSPVKAEAGSSDSQASPSQLVVTRKDGKKEVKRRPTQ